jgi:hypothetical protein
VEIMVPSCPEKFVGVMAVCNTAVDEGTGGITMLCLMVGAPSSRCMGVLIDSRSSSLWRIEVWTSMLLLLGIKDSMPLALGAGPSVTLFLEIGASVTLLLETGASMTLFLGVGTSMVLVLGD